MRPGYESCLGDAHRSLIFERSPRFSAAWMRPDFSMKVRVIPLDCEHLLHTQRLQRAALRNASRTMCWSAPSRALAPLQRRQQGDHVIFRVTAMATCAFRDRQ